MGGQTFYIVATDGNLQNQAVETKTLLLPPGSRLEVLVYGPPSGIYQLQDAAFNTGPAGDQYPGQLMMTVVSKGAPVENPIPIPPPSAFPKLPDLRAATLVNIGPSSLPTPLTRTCSTSMASPTAPTV